MTFTQLVSRPPKADMLPGFVDARARELEDLHDARSPAESLARRDELRKAVIECLGLKRLPETAAVARSVGRIEKDAYTIEKLVIEALPGLLVPALLYLPSDVPTPVPAVVHQPGHWMENAKLEPELQRTNAWLARSGIAVLCHDPVGEGERRLGWHQHGQLATLLVGFTTLAVMVAEIGAALDVLASRDEVDASRLGVVGASGGGWASIFAAALDPRIQAAAIVCIVNTHRGQISAARGTGWDGAVCLCNQLPGLCAIGSIAEIMALVAPRALLQVSAVDDPPFPIQGARLVSHQLTDLYAAAGAQAAYTYVEVDGGHGFRPSARRATVSWLCERLGGQATPHERVDEPLLQPPYATTYLDVADDPAARQVFRRPPRLEGECLATNVDSNLPMLELARRRVAALRGTRPSFKRDALESILGPFPEHQPLDTSVEMRIRLHDGYGERLSFTSEALVRLDAVLLLPDSWADDAPPVLIVFDPAGKAAALHSPEVEAARGQGWAVLAPDVRGTGESACAEWETATAAFMLDRDLLTQRVWDARRCVEVLWRRAVVGQQIDRGRIALWGRGTFGMLALAAAALDDRVAAAGCSAFPASLEDLLVVVPEQTPMLYRYRLLEALDIEHLELCIRPRPIVRDDVGALLEALS